MQVPILGYNHGGWDHANCPISPGASCRILNTGRIGTVVQCDACMEDIQVPGFKIKCRTMNAPSVVSRLIPNRSRRHQVVPGTNYAPA